MEESDTQSVGDRTRPSRGQTRQSNPGLTRENRGHGQRCEEANGGHRDNYRSALDTTSNHVPMKAHQQHGDGDRPQEHYLWNNEDAKRKREYECRNPDDRND